MLKFCGRAGTKRTPEHPTRTRSFLLLQGLVLLLALPAFSYAQTPIEQGELWLFANQGVDGSIATAPALSPRDTAVAVRALLQNREASSETTQALIYLSGVPEQTAQFRALRIQALFAGEYSVVSLLDSLFDFRNGAGFGAFGHHESNLFDTALAIEALATDEPARVSAIVPLLDYLLLNQNANGGWGLLPGAPSELYYTAEVLLAFEELDTLAISPTAKSNAIAFLMSRRQLDGSFGTVLETAQSFRALLASGYDVASLSPSPVSVLVGQQMFDGSWEHDVFTTAHALLALQANRPNLVVTALSLTTPNPHPGTTLTFSATVKNTGLTLASASELVLRVGSSTSTDERATASIPSLASGGEAIVSLEAATQSTESLVNFFAVADGRETVLEINEGDNARSLQVNLRSDPDLALFSGDVSVSPSQPAPNTNFTLRIAVRNIGETAVASFGYTVYKIVADQPPSVLFNASAGPANPGTGTIINLTMNLPKGEHTVRVILDPAEVVTELDETNNEAEFTFFVADTNLPDFSIVPTDFSVTPATAIPGQSVVVAVTIRNLGLQAGSTKVDLYDGIPGAGGVLLHQFTTNPIAPNGSQILTRPIVVGAGTSYRLVAVADFADLAEESNEANNRADKFLQERPDLAIGFDDLGVAPNAPLPGETVTVSVRVRNGGTLEAVDSTVHLFDGDPASGGTVVGSLTTPSIPAGGSRPVSFSWTAVGGLRTLVAIADYADAIVEFVETNNRTEREISVPRASGPDLVVTSVDTSTLTQSSETFVFDGSLTAVVTNEGDALAAAPFVVRVFEDRNGDGRLSPGEPDFGSATVTESIAVGASSSLTIPVTGLAEFFHPLLWVEADATGAVSEKREDNNRHEVFGICETTPPPGSLTPIEKWWVTGIDVLSTPVVVQLTDDNGDGQIDSRDIPDVVFSASAASGRAIKAVSGLDGSKIWDFLSSVANPFNYNANPAAADLDGDGYVEVIVVQSNNRLLALDHLGRPKWVSDLVESTSDNWFSGAVAIGDLTADGVPEIALGRVVLSNTGTKLGQGTANRGRNFNSYGISLNYVFDAPMSVIADVVPSPTDPSGRSELIAGDTVYRLEDGVLNIVWDNVVPDNLMTDGFVAIGNLDTQDSNAEIVYVSSNQIMVLNHNGSTRRESKFIGYWNPSTPWTAPMWGGPPSIANLDGVGLPEILVTGNSILKAFSADLTLLWEKPTTDYSEMAPATAFDLDGDGVAEVIYRDVTNFYLLNGKTGLTLASIPMTSGTRTEIPVVADVDADGSADILVSSTRPGTAPTSTQGLHAYSNPSWMGTRPVWNEHSYHVTNVLESGGVPSAELPSWQVDNTFRANAQRARGPRLLPNLTLGLPRVGEATGAGVPVTLRVGNGGRAAAPAGTVIELFEGATATGTPVGQGATTKGLTAGEWEDVIVFWQAASSGTVNAVAAIDRAGRVSECDEADNLLSFVFTGTLLPDLSIPAGGVTAPASTAGQIVTVTVQVTNVGVAVAPATVVRLYEGDPAGGIQVAEAPVPAVTAGSSVSVPVLWDTIGQSGTHVIHALADAAGTLVEVNEENNEGVLVITLNAATKPDLAAHSLTVSPASVAAGVPVLLRAWVRNRGLDLTTGFAVGFFANGAEVGRVQVSQSLPYAAAIDIDFTLATTALLGRIALEARADPSGVLAEQNETNNVAAGEVVVSAPTVQVAVATDKQSYQAEQPVAIAVTLINLAGSSQTLSFAVMIVDSTNALIATVVSEPVTLPPGATNLSLGWNTGSALPGVYAVRAELADGTGAILARRSASFSIARESTAEAVLYTDREVYAAQQTVLATGTVRNTSANEILYWPSLRFVVLAPNGLEVAESVRAWTLPALFPDSSAPIDASWAVGASAPGQYTATFSLRDSAGSLRAYASRLFRIEDSAETGAGLAGTLSVAPRLAGAGAPLEIALSVSNAGNADLATLAVRIDLLRLDDEVSVPLATFPLPLVRGATGSRTFGQSTVDFLEGDYLVTLVAVLPGIETVLDRRSLTLARAISILDAARAEGDAGSSVLEFTLRLSSAASEAVTASFATQDGTARAGSDYVASSGTVTFAPTETMKSIAVSVTGDTDPESDESFLVSLSGVVNALVADGQALGTIQDEEGCVSPNLLRNGDAEDGTTAAPTAGWTEVGEVGSPGWGLRLTSPAALSGQASFSYAGSGEMAELRQDVDVSAFASQVDAGSQVFQAEAYVYAAVLDAALVTVEYRDAANQTVLASFTSSGSGTGTWASAADSRGAPVGTRWIRVRLLAAGAATPVAFFDRVGVRSLGTPVLTVSDATVTEGDSGNTTAAFSVRLSCSNVGALAVGYTTEDASARAGEDYIGVTGTLNLSGSQLTGTIEVDIIGDTTDEPEEKLNLRISAPDVVVLDALGEGTILDDDGPVVVSIADVNVAEGDSGAVNAVFTLMLSGPSGQSVSVAYATRAGTAQSGVDFTAAAGTVSFPPGTTEQTVAVSVLGDRLNERPESLFVDLSNATHATLGDPEGMGTILDDDVVEISVADISVLEGDSGTTSAVFTVSLSVPSVETVTLSYATTDGTAVAGVDYVFASGSLSFAPGQQTLAVPVGILTNLVLEPTKTFTLVLSNPAFGLLVDPEAVCSIVDDDGILISVADLTVKESASAFDAIFKVKLSKATNITVSVAFATFDGSATSGLDYSAAVGTATFAPNVTSVDVRVPILADTLEELVETFSLRLSNPTNAEIRDGEAIATLADNDRWSMVPVASDTTMPGCIVLVPDVFSRVGAAWRIPQIDLNHSFDHTYKVHLGDNDLGSSGMVFALQRTGLNAIGLCCAPLGFGGPGLTPAFGVEIDAWPTGTDPSFDHMTVLQYNLGVTTALSPAVQASATSANVEDGAEHDLRVIWNTDSKVFDAQFDGSERVTYQGDLINTLFGGNPNVYFGFTAGSGSNPTNLIYFCETAPCTGPVSSPQISIGSARLFEPGSGSAAMLFPVTLACPGTEEVRVDVTTEDLSATAGSDYDATNATIVFLPGETSKSFSVAIRSDLVNTEPSETFAVRLTGAVGGVVRYDNGVGTISDLTIVVAASNGALPEADRAMDWMASVRLSAPAQAAFTVSFTTANGTAVAGLDYTASSGTLSFAAGQIEKTVTFGVLGDLTVEPSEEFRLNFTSALPAFGSRSLSITIADDDRCASPNLLKNPSGDAALVGGAVPEWTVVSGNWTQRANPAPFDGSAFFYAGRAEGTTVAELRQDADVSMLASAIDAGTQRFEFTGVARSVFGPPTDSSRIIVEYRSSPGGPILASYDSGEMINKLIWQAAGELRLAPVGTRSIRVRLISTHYEGSENNGYYDALVLRALDAVWISIDDATTTEGEAGRKDLLFPVRLINCSAAAPVSVDYLSGDGTATAGSDYDLTSGTLTFEPGETAKTIAVPILGDTIPEGDETFAVTLLNPANAFIYDGTAAGTILQDEAFLSIADLAVVEGDAGTKTASLVVTLSRPSALTVSAEFATSAGTATGGENPLEGVDYLSATGVVSLAPGQTSQTIMVQIVGDTLSEPDETFDVTLSSPVNAGFSDSTATATIAQDDIELSISDARVTEGDTGLTDAVFTLSLSGPSSTTVSVVFATRPVSATAGVDYTTRTGTSTFAPGEVTKILDVSVKGDTVIEPNEAFAVDLSNPVNARLAQTEAIGAILDDDDCPSPEIVRNPGNEAALVGGEIPDWTEVSGTTWTQVGGGFQGKAFDPGITAFGELRQDVDVSMYAGFIDRGIQRFMFQGYVRSSTAETPRDRTQIIVEYRDAANASVLLSFESPQQDVGTWEPISDVRPAPPGTRTVRIRLLATRVSGTTADVLFDSISLQSLTSPVIQVDDVELGEGDEANVALVFDVRLTCPSATTVTVDYATVDGTAKAGEDYIASTGTVTFAPGSTNQPVTIETIGDFKHEIRESFQLVLSNWVEGAVLDPQATGTIRDADPGKPPVGYGDFVYTLDEHFEFGSLTRLHHDAPVNDQIQVAAAGAFPYLWVPASARGTIVKIDTDSGEILGEYSTNPDTGPSSNASRMAVTLDGTVWVTNRAENGAAHVGLSEFSQCVDRNNNGFIDTSSGYDDVLDWPNTGGADTQGGVSTAKDECIQHYVRTYNTGARHLSVTSDNSVWVTGTGGSLQKFQLISSETGQILREETLPCGGYGGLTDGQGVVWSVDNYGTANTSKVLRWDPSRPVAEARCLSVLNAYGMAIDPQGFIWVTSFDTNVVYKISPDGNQIVSYPRGGGTGNAQGLAIDALGNVWIGSSLFNGVTVAHLKTDGTFVGTVTGVPHGSTGVAIDHRGRVWTSNINASSASRIDPTKGPLGAGGIPIGEVDLVVDLPGAHPYNLGDMTGFVALNATSPRGLWMVIQDAHVANAEWGTITWNLESPGSVPPGASIGVEVRAADSVTALGSKTWSTVQHDQPFAQFGRYLQVRVTLRPNSLGASPVLSDIRIRLADQGEFSLDDVTVLEGNSGTTGAAFTVRNAKPANRPVSVDVATADDTATAPSDYATTGGTVTFAPFETEKSVVVPVVGDLFDELTEAFFLQLSNPVHGTIVDAQGTATIVNDDAGNGPRLEATKSDVLALDADGDGRVTQGDTLEYTIQIANTGTNPATGVVFDDPAPANAPVVAGSVTTSRGTVESESPVRVAVGSLAPSESVTITLRVKIDSPLPPEVIAISNQGTVSSAELPAFLTDDPSEPGSQDPTVTPVEGEPVLSVQKDDVLAADNDGSGSPSPGDEIHYDLAIASIGRRSATGVVLTDLIPTHTSFVVGSVLTSQGTIESTDPIRINLGELVVATTATVSFRVRIVSPVPPGTTEISNQATVTSIELPAVLSDDPAVGGTADPTVTPITAVPVLVTEKTDALLLDADANGVPSPDDTLRYTVTIANDGHTAATLVALDDAIPVNTAIVTGSATTSRGTIASENPLRVTVGEIAVGETVTISFDVTIDSPFPAGTHSVTNQGQVTCAELPAVLTDDPDVGGSADPTVTEVTALPRLTATKIAMLFSDADGDGLASPGDAVLYQIQISNGGNSAATNVQLTDSIPANTAVLPETVQTSQGSIVGTDPVTILVGVIPAGATASVSFQVQISAAFPFDQQAISNQATITSAELPTLVTDDPATSEANDPTVTPVTITPSIAIADISVAESVGNAVFSVTLSQAANREVRVDFAAASGTALSGVDYEYVTGQLTFAPGETIQTLSVTILNDAIDEIDETFLLMLSGVVGATLPDAEAQAIILDDDDVRTTVVIADVTILEGASGASTALFAVTLDPPSGRETSVDYTVTAGTATAGTDFIAASGTLVIPAGDTAASISATVLGDLVDEVDETFLVQLTNPVHVILSDALGLGTILDDDEARTTVVIADVAILEGASGSTTAIFALTLDPPSGRETSVDYTVTAGTATAGTDFIAASGTLLIPAGDTAASITATVLGDLLDEVDETFFVQLTNPVHVILSDALGLGTILDDDEAQTTVVIADVAILEGASGTSTAIFALTLDPPSGRETSVDYTVTAGTATAGTDFIAASGTLVIPAGDTAASITATVLGDLLDEVDETFFVQLTNPVHLILSDALGLGTILDDDEARTTVVIADVAILEGASGSSTAIFALTLDPASGRETSVDYSVTAGTATAGTDFIAASGTLLIPAGDTAASISATVLGDLLDEVDETFFVQLTNPVHLILSDALGLGTILDDDEPPPTISLAPASQIVAAGATGTLTLTISAAQTTDTTIVISSSNAAVVAAPASIVLPAFTTTHVFAVAGLSVGGPVAITATLPASLFGGSASAEVSVVLTGTLAASTPVTQGDDVRFDVTLANVGSTAVFDQPFAIEIRDPASGTIAATVLFTASVPAGGSSSTTLTYSSATLAIQSYTAHLLFLGLAEPVLLASSSFDVVEVPPFACAADLDGPSRLLLWVNCSPGNSGNPCTLVTPPFLSQTLTAAGIPYRIVGDEYTFLAEVRTGAYDAAVIYQPAPAEPKIAEEYLEDIRAGLGLVFVNNSPNAMPKLAPALQTSSQGVLHGPTSIDLVETPFTQPGTLSLNGDGVRIQLEGAAAAGVLTGTTTPAISYASLAAGRTVLIPYDTELTPTTAVADLLLAAIGYVSRPPASGFDAGQVVAIHFQVTTRPGGDSAVTLEVTLPAGVSIVDASPTLSVTTPPTWNLIMPGDTTADFYLWVRLSETLGTYTISGAVGFQNQPPLCTEAVVLEVTANRGTLANALAADLVALRALATEQRDRNLLDDAIAELAAIQAVTDPDAAGVLAILERILNITADLGEVSLDTTQARADADRFLVYWQARAGV